MPDIAGRAPLPDYCAWVVLRLASARVRAGPAASGGAGRRLKRMASTTDILAAYDSQLRRLVPPAVPPGHEYQLLGPLLRVTGQRRGFIESARDLGVEGGMLDRMIVEQREYFACRGGVRRMEDPGA